MMIKPFIHLRTLSSFSLAEGALKIENIVKLAKKNNMPAIAITDNNNMFGVFEFSQECVKNNIQPIIGTSINYLEINDKENISQISLLVKNEEGYKKLLQVLNFIRYTTDLGIIFETSKTLTWNLE